MNNRIICGVYCILNINNGKIYIGSSKDIHFRWKTHKLLLKNNKHHSRHLQSAWNKYGKENFEFFVVEECSLEDRVCREQYYMDLYKSYDSNYGYNISIKANSGVLPMDKRLYGEKAYQCIYSQEQIEKAISLLLIGNYSYVKVSEITDIDYNTIAGLVRGVTWRELTRDITFPKPKISSRENVKLTEKDVKNIVKLILNGKTNKEISEQYNVNIKTISDIRNHKSWNDITNGINFIRSPRNSKPTKLQQDIINLKNSGSNYTNAQIAKLTNSSISMVSSTIRKYKNILME